MLRSAPRTLGVKLLSTTHTDYVDDFEALRFFPLLVLSWRGFLATTPVISVVKKGAAVNIQDDARLIGSYSRATSTASSSPSSKKTPRPCGRRTPKNWLGYWKVSRTMIKGIDGYMDWNRSIRKVLRMKSIVCAS